MQTKVSGIAEAIEKSRLVIPGAGHFCGGELIAESQAAVGLAEPELSPNRVTAGITPELRGSRVEFQPGCLAGGRIGFQYRLQVP